jgi:hypothetical protein
MSGIINGRTGASMYRNDQKPSLKGSAAWFLGTKYCSEHSQFDYLAARREALPEFTPPSNRVY